MSVLHSASKSVVAVALLASVSHVNASPSPSSPSLTSDSTGNLVPSTSSRTVRATELSHQDVVWLAENAWGVHSAVLSELASDSAFTLADLDCSFLDALKQEPFRFMRFKKFCDKAKAAAQLSFVVTTTASSTGKAGENNVNEHDNDEFVQETILSIEVATDDDDRRKLAEASNDDWSGIRVARDQARISMGVDGDVSIYRHGDNQLGVKAEELLVGNNLTVGGCVTVKNVTLCEDDLAGLLGEPAVVQELPEDCNGQVWVENQGFYECIHNNWVRTYDASCDDNPHSLEAHILYNGGVELGVDDDGYALGWEEYCCGSYSATDASQGEVTTDLALCGRHSLHWKSTTTANWDLIEQTKAMTFEMVGGCTYSTSFWAYCTDLNREFDYPGHFRTEFLQYGSSDSYTGLLDTTDDSFSTFRAYHTVSKADEGKWTYFEHPGMTVENDEYGVRMNFGMVSGWKGECFVDHLQIYSTDCDVEPMYICGDASNQVDHPDQGNLIFNGGFEILEENDHTTVAEGDYAAGFARYGSYGSTGLLSDDNSKCGDYAAKFTSSSSDTDWDLIENDGEHPIELVEGCTYELSFCAINTDGAGDLRTEFLKRANGGQSAIATTDDSEATYVEYHEFEGEDLWECFSHVFDPSSNQTAYLNFGMVDGWTGTFYIDDVHLASTNCKNLAPAWRDCSEKEGNMFPNGHFEDLDVGQYPSADWQTYYSPDGVTATVSTSQAYCGSNSLRYSSSSEIGWALLMNSACIEMDANEDYLLSYWAYYAGPSEGASGSALAENVRSEFLYYTNSADTAYDGLLGTTSSSEDDYVRYHTLTQGYVWTYFEHPLTPSTDYSCVKMNFGMQQGWSGTYYFDKIELVCQTC